MKGSNSGERLSLDPKSSERQMALNEPLTVAIPNLLEQVADTDLAEDCARMSFNFGGKWWNQYKKWWSPTKVILIL